LSAIVGRAAILFLSAAFATPALAPARAQDAPSPPPTELRYDLLYDVQLAPSERAARVTIRLGEGAWMVKRVRFRIDPERQRDFRGDGEIVSEGEALVWRPPTDGGALHYVFTIDHLRDAKSYDARCAENWALFRGDDLVPPARVLAEVGARSRAQLRLRLPDGWSAAVPYERLDDGSYGVDDAGRRFDRPVGWFVLGRLGVLRERIAGSRVAVAGPVQQGLRRHDILALLRWTLPELRRVVGQLPERLLLVGAGDPMWRGGLSGPHSLFVHADRPLISADLTSPVLHEVVHAALGIRPGSGGDWIVEGLAELYSLEMLVRSRTVSRRRYRRALTELASEGRSAQRLEVDHSEGATTARAVTVLHALDEELRQGSESAISLDVVVARLVRGGVPVTTEGLQTVAEMVSGRDLGRFFRSQMRERGG
jgi:hypothetical protein